MLCHQLSVHELPWQCFHHMHKLWSIGVRQSTTSTKQWCRGYSVSQLLNRNAAVNSRFFRSTIPDYITENDIDEDLFCEYTQDLSGDNRKTCLHTYTATTETVELVLSNVADSDFSSHPVHIHGHYFHVLHVGYPDYNVEGQIISKNQDLNCIPPTMDSAIRVCHGMRSPTPIFLSRVRHLPLKDTITIPGGGYVRVRFARNNPGWWLLHCHIETHVLIGMVIVINTTSAPGDVQIPDNFPRCGHFNSATSSTQPTEKEDTTYQSTTIGLAIVCGALLLMLVIVT